MLQQRLPERAGYRVFLLYVIMFDEAIKLNLIIAEMRSGPAVIKLLQNSTPNKSQTPKYMLHSSRAENRRL